MILAAVGLAALLVSTTGTTTVTPTMALAASAPATVRFLFDLGDGSYYWADGNIPDPAAINATWNASLDAATRLGLAVRWAWFSCCGVFIQDIGDRSPPSGAVGVFLFNAITRSWDPASVGVSSLVLQSGDSVAFSNNAFDPVTYATLTPVPTPDNPFPVLEFRGDSANTGASLSSAPRGLEVSWDRDLGIQEIPSSPAVAYGRVYILTLDGLFALDESTGSVLWTNQHIMGLSTPAVFNGTLILGGSDGKVHAIDAATGREVWNTILIANPVFSGITSSPKILFDTAYVGTFNESGGAGEVVAMWATNGTIVWRHAAPGSVSFSSPAIVDSRLFAGIIGRYNTTTQVTYDPPYGVLALDATDGAQLWFHATGGPVAASPAVADGLVYAPSKDGRLYAMDVVDGTVRWSSVVQAGVSSPAVWNGTLFVAGGAFGGPGRVTAMDAFTGDVEWTFAPNGPVQSSVTYADGKVFFSTNVANGTIYALDAAAGRLAWAFTPSPAQFILGSPVAADDRLFAPSDNGHVYAFQEPQAVLSVNTSLPPSLWVGQNATLLVTLTAAAGYAAEVNVSLALEGIQAVSAEPNYSWVENDAYYWSLGDIPFEEQRTITVQVQVPCLADGAGGCRETALHGTVVARSLDVTGHPNSDTAYNFQLFISQRRIATEVFPWLLFGVSLAVVAAVILVAAVFVRNRRRSGRAP